MTIRLIMWLTDVRNVCKVRSVSTTIMSVLIGYYNEKRHAELFVRHTSQHRGRGGEKKTHVAWNNYWINELKPIGAIHHEHMHFFDPLYDAGYNWCKLRFTFCTMSLKYNAISNTTHGHKNHIRSWIHTSLTQIISFILSVIYWTAPSSWIQLWKDVNS